MCSAMVINIAHQMYYVDVIDANGWDSNQLESLNTKVTEVYCKEHIIMFHKRSHVCDPTLDIKFLHHVQVHHNMNSKPEILMEKLQMLVSAFVSNEPKVHWLKQWNQFAVLYVVQKDPM
jgi:hypothetical protein